MPTHPVFKFVSVRPPERPSLLDVSTDLPPVVLDRPTLLLDQIAALDGQPRARILAEERAGDFLDSPRYAPSSPEWEGRLRLLARMEEAVRQLPPIAAPDRLRDALTNAAGEDLGRLVDNEAFRTFEENVWDSLYAHALLPGARPADRDPLFRAVRMLRLLRLVTGPNREGGPSLLPVRSLLAASPIIPPALFPASAAEQPEPPPEPPPSPSETLLQARERLRSARDAVDRLLRRSRARLLGESGSGEEGEAAPPGEEEEVDACAPMVVRLRSARPRGVQRRPPWRLDARDFDRETRRVLEELGSEPDVEDAPRIIDRLERAIGRVNARLAALEPRRAIRTIGSTGVPHGEPVALAFTFVQPAGGLPGVQPPIRPPAPAPQPPPSASFRVLGIGDLLVVRETLLRYEAGEIAHVENVLAGEVKEREHRRLRQSEETEVFETEIIGEQERDLESADRYELQKESQRTIDTEAAAQAGLSVSATYGMVSVSSNADFSYSSARSESERTASTYARSVTERAAARIRERVREQRVRRALEEVEETNTHSLNAPGPGHVRGVYQWLDKIHSMQVVNYGRRLMLEFIIPEPAAFYIFAQGKSSAEGAARDKPIPPEELGLTSHEVLDAGTFPIFAAAYRVEDAKPPPPGRMVIAKAYNQDIMEGAQVSSKADSELMMPAGYRATVAHLTYTAFYRTIVGRRGREVIDPNQGGYIQIGNAFASLEEASSGANRSLNYEDSVVPFSVITNHPAWILNVEVECELRPETLVEWQVETYGTILAAYKAQKAAYDEELARASVRQGIQIRGRNPASNRRIEREELQKGCITLMSGTRYEEPDIIDPNRNAAFDGFPEIATGALEQRARTLQFLEQAFEWNQMTYLLYPYFWGRKAGWLDRFPLEDADPKFTDFLRAGAARVVIPATPGYEQAVLFYLATGVPFGGGPAPTLQDPLYLSIVDELRRRQGEHFADREGVLSVRNGQRLVNGVGTAFAEDDENRELRIRATVYRVQRVNSPTQALLSGPYAGADEDDVPYSIGALLVGQPWQVRVPTSLVHLRDDAQLPVFAEGTP